MGQESQSCIYAVLGVWGANRCETYENGPDGLIQGVWPQKLALKSTALYQFSGQDLLHNKVHKVTTVL